MPLFTNKEPPKGPVAHKKKGKKKAEIQNGSHSSLPTTPPQSSHSQDEQRPRLPIRPPPSRPAPSPPRVLANSKSSPNLLRQSPEPMRPDRRSHDRRPSGNGPTSIAMNQGAALADRVSDQMNHILTNIDHETSNEYHYAPLTSSRSHPPPTAHRPQTRHNPRAATYPEITTKLPTSTHFAKVWSYANSRLPPHLPPLKLYLPTYPLLCLSASHSLSVYAPSPQQSPATAPLGRATSVISTTHHIPSSLRTGTKAMTVAAATHDTSTSPVILVAIRGTSTFMDWAVNARQAPTPPTDFLLDEGNLCHAGFLAVARSMAPRIAEVLKSLLEEKPERAGASIVLTGHSAGGAVAALLYAHCIACESSPLLAERSELAELASVFKRVHCVTFGAPPVSLLPLQKPEGTGNKRIEKSLFFAFVNEGDPVSRADVTYVKSLLALYTAPVPEGRGAVWPTPPGTLSLAGRVVLLRPRPRVKENDTAAEDKQALLAPKSRGLFKRSSPNLREDAGRDEERRGSGSGKLEACMITDEELRGVVFGDPEMHAMRLYAERVERLAVDAVTAGGMALR